MSDTSCLRPDGKWCEHPRDEHGHDHPYVGQYCMGCFLADGGTIGPYIHDWNPHIQAGMLGWTPMLDEPERVFRWMFE